MLTVSQESKFKEYYFHDIKTLAEAAEKLGKRAIELGLISGFTVHLFSDCWQFSLASGQESELLTPQEAYFQFKKIVEHSER